MTQPEVSTNIPSGPRHGSVAVRERGSRLGGSKGSGAGWEQDGAELAPAVTVPRLCHGAAQESRQSSRKGTGGSQRSSRWARAEAGRGEDPPRWCRGAKHSTRRPWEAGTAPPARVKNAGCQQRRAGAAGGRCKPPGAAPAGLGSPEGNGVKQEMKNGNAACHAQRNNKKNPTQM